uniref:Uncharacterized protein n=1 Tax=Aegilops tauschii subsp. strangulata TaxID=200361 RepID=A0A453L0Z2_AEGTS
MLFPLNDLRNIFGSGKHEAQAIISDIESQAYRNRLAKIFSTDLAVAPNKASKISAKSYSMILNLRARCIKAPGLPRGHSEDVTLVVIFMWH